jgi:thiamine transporter
MMMGMDDVSAAFLPSSEDYMGALAIVMVLLDYIVAYTALGLGGIFRDRISKPGTALMCGSIVALSARYVTHIASGFLLYSSWAEWFFTQDGFPAWGGWLVEHLSPEMLGFVYSVVYNGMFMIPEIIFTAVMSLIIARIPGIVTKVD